MLFERVYPARGAPRARSVVSGSTAASIAIHVAVMAAVVASGATPERVAQRITESLVYLAPPPSTASSAAASEERVAYAELAPLTLPLLTDMVDPLALAAAAMRAPETTTVRRDEVGRPPEPEKPVSVFERPASAVYFAHQVESPAAFDARSAAPAYPDSLQQAGIEGSVIAQFVVDTAGRVEIESFVLLESTHVRFTESVRAALPGMLFRPAVLSGAKTRQLVQIPFRFQMARDSLAPPPGRAGAPPPPPPPRG